MNFFKRIFSSQPQQDDENEQSFVKEDDRYYFDNGRCSIKLSKEEILGGEIEKNGLKHLLISKKIGIIIIEIRDSMPTFPSSSNILIENIFLPGFSGIKVNINPIISQCYINCKEFVVQIDMSIFSQELLDSFRVEGKTRLKF